MGIVFVRGVVEIIEMINRELLKIYLLVEFLVLVLFFGFFV